MEPGALRDEAKKGSQEMAFTQEQWTQPESFEQGLLGFWPHFPVTS